MLPDSRKCSPVSFLHPAIKSRSLYSGVEAGLQPHSSSHPTTTITTTTTTREHFDVHPPYSQDAECEGPRHALAVSHQEAAIAARPSQQLLRCSSAQVAVIPGRGRAAQRAPGARRPTH